MRQEAKDPFIVRSSLEEMFPKLVDNDDVSKPNFSAECMKRCPELHSCVAELALRQLTEPDIQLGEIINEHQEEGTLPQSCMDGPVHQGAGGRASVGYYSDVAQATVTKIDAWGDSVSIRCRSQGDISGGNIRSIR